MKNEHRISEYLEGKGHDPADVDTHLRTAKLNNADYNETRSHIQSTLGEDINNA